MAGGKSSKKRRGLSGVSLATRIAGAILLIGLFSLTVATAIGLTTGRDLGRDVYEDRVAALRGSGSSDIAAELGSLERTTAALADSPQTAAALARLTAAFQDLSEATPGDVERRAERLAEAYQDAYLEPLRRAGLETDLRDLVNEDNPASLYLQSAYSIDFEPLSRASAVDDARDGSAWTETHAQVHPVFRQIAEDLDLFDVLLVDAASGYVVYSVEKHPDLGANVDVGPISGSIVAALTDRVRADPEAGVAVADFRRYAPSLLTPVAGMAAPVLDQDGSLLGVLVLLFDSSEFTRLLTAQESWDDAGFPPGGDLYLVGADGTTRSEPRGFLEDRDEFLDAAEETGQLDAESRELIDRAGTTVLTLSANDATLRAVEDGVDDIERHTTIDGRAAIGSAQEIPFDGVDWAIVAEVDRTLAVAAVNDFEERLLVGAALFILALAFVAVWWARSVVKPVRSLGDRLASEGADLEAGGDEARAPISVPDRSGVEFHRLAASFEVAATTLRTRRRELADARAERIALIRQMLPSSVADRLASGDVQAVDEAPDASIVVLAVVGLGSVDDGSGPGLSARAFLEALFGEFDAIAREHGLEPIKVVGDEYYASCGHDRPFIDHAPRALTFASEAFHVIRERTDGGAIGVDLAAGIASGPVTVGLTGRSGLVYDVWGPTAHRADRLARAAGRGRLLVDDDTLSKLPDTTEAAPLRQITGQMAWDVASDDTEERV